MRIIDEKAQKNVRRYVFQCSLATLTILIVLMFLDVLSHTAIIATLGASAFVVFTMPKSYSSKPRPLIGGYIVGISVGCLCHFLSILRLVKSIVVTQTISYVIFGGLAVGIAVFLMVITNTEHPPAAGMPLGLVLNKWDYLAIVFILGAIILMAGIRELLKPTLIDLK